MNDDIVQGLWPQPIAAELVERPTHLVCGNCGFDDEVTHYIFTDAPWCFEPVCNCPIPATLTA